MGKPSEPGKDTDSNTVSVDDDLPSIDVVLDLVSHPYRRAVLEIVLTRQDALTVIDVARLIVKREHDTDVPSVGTAEITRQYLALHHAHVPKLIEAGVVEYDADLGTIRPTDRFERLKRPLSLLFDLDVSAE